ncbi:UNVERIFIED_CONTAM: hypothetical protein K2H54_029197 [Gekko kuhli]
MQPGNTERIELPRDSNWTTQINTASQRGRQCLRRLPKGKGYQTHIYEPNAHKPVPQIPGREEGLLQSPANQELSSREDARPASGAGALPLGHSLSPGLTQMDIRGCQERGLLADGQQLEAFSQFRRESEVHNLYTAFYLSNTPAAQFKGKAQRKLKGKEIVQTRWTVQGITRKED